MAATPFCGRCGYPVTPGSPFCGRCGAPQGVVPAATYPAYTYPVAPPETRIGGIKLTHVVLAGGLVLILLVATLVVSVFTVSTINSNRAPCRANCGPKLYVPLAAANTYRSPAYKFEVDYSSNWSVRSQDAAGISLGTRFGHMDITGMKTEKSPDQVISDVVANLPSSDWQSVERVTDIKGAHVGDQAGVGYLYSANFTGSNATGTKVRFAAIAAVRNGVTVVVFAVNPSDTKDYVSGMPEAQAFDHVLNEFRWAS